MISVLIKGESDGMEDKKEQGSFPALHSFKYRDFRWLWIGTFFSFAAVNMQQITRGWLILRLTDDSPLALSLVMMSFALPLTFASLIGGAMADRVARQKMIIICQSGNAFMTLLLAILDITGLVRFWHLMVLGFINGTLAAFNMPSRQSIVSDIVSQKELMNAISLNSAGMNLTRIVGPALAGFLIIYFDTGLVFLMIACVHAVSVVCTSFIATGKKSTSDPGQGVFSDILLGFRYARGNSTLFCLVIMCFVPALFGFPYIALLPAWAKEVLDVKADGLGFLMMFMGLGSLTGTLVLASIRHMKKRGTVLLANSLGWGISLFVFSQSLSYSTAFAALFLVGLISAVFMSLNMTLMQSYSSNEMRGRIVSMAMMTFGIMPLSAVPFGAVAEKIGTANSLGIAGVLLLLFTITFIFLFPRFRKIS